MSKATKDNKANQSVKKVISNNLFWLGLMFKASPKYMTLVALDSFRNQFSIFCEHTLLIGYVLEAAEFHYPFKRVATIILLAAALIGLGMLFSVYVYAYTAEIEKPKIKEKIKLLLYEKAKDLDLECYDNPDFYNEQVLVLTEVDKQIDRGVEFVTNAVGGITAFVSTGIFFIFKDMWSAVFVLVSFILTFALNQVFKKMSFKIRMERYPSERKRDYVKRVFYMSEYAKEIRLNPNVSDLLMEHFEKSNEDVYQTEKKYAGKRFLLQFAKEHLSNNMIADFFYVSYLVFKAAFLKVMSFSTLVILYNSFYRMRESLRIFTDVYPFAAETSLYVQKIRDFLDYEEKITSEKNLEPKAGAKEISVKKAVFSYSENQDEIIRNLSFDIKKGEKVALVGYNGAGKTTLVKLLMRLYDVNSGEITADGINIKDMDVKKYRNTIGTVFQDFKIFAGSVKENVLLDDVDSYDKEGLNKALDDSGLLSRVNRMSMGINTPLTHEFDDNGIDLSGGEAQKLAISRVFYQKAGLMILDEPSSALDPIAEYQLNHAMMSATGDNTVIFISHRLSTTRLADRIIMLENGQIVEQGSHDELLKKDGKYAEMWKVQAGAYIAV